MKLSELFRNATAAPTDENGEGIVISQKNLNTLKLSRQIKALVPGQTIHGEVVSKKGGEVLIKLAEDMVLSARLEKEMSIDMGKIMTFEVRNNGKALTLSPLFANTATDANVLKALDMASIPVNDTTVEMTQSMMEQGMSIDKNSLQNVYRSVTSNMDAAVRDIVQLHQLGVEVTEETIHQLKNYQGMQHQLTGAVNQIAEEISVYLEGLAESENPQDEVLLFTKLSMILGKTDSAVSGGDLLLEVPNANVQKEAMPPMQNGSLNLLLSPEEVQVLAEEIKQLDPQGTDVKIQNLLNRFTEGTVTVFDIKDVVDAKDFTWLLKKQMMESWLLEPKQTEEKENVEKVYQRMSRQLSEMQRVLSEIPGADKVNVIKSVTNMQGNLDFMNQLNQSFTYIQLPLRMSEKETHGDLYVYTNKRNLAAKDGNLSAFLHLDMDKLGPVDVYIAMHNQKVNTKFYLKDDEMIDFIQDHIHILNERLAKRGYSMNCEMLVKEQAETEKSVLERITEKEKNVTVLSHYAFDVRA